MKRSEKLCIALNKYFPPPPNPGGRESERAYQEMQFHNAGKALEFYQRYVDFNGKTVLDLGCGLGGKTVYYGLHSRAGSILGIDVIEKFTALATDFALMRGASEKVQFRVTPPNKLEWQAAAFDIILSNDTMEHVEHPEQMMTECHRILKPAGYMCIDFGPLYYSHRGAHIYDYIHIPWCHLLFTQQTLINVIRQLPEHPHSFGHDRTIVRFTGLNKLTVRRFRSIVKHLDFDILYWQIGREKRIKGIPVAWISYIPFLGNLFRTTITCVLRKN